MRVLIVVTHLLGSGHLARALTIARAFVAAGHDVRVASGGMPIDRLDTRGIDLVQLPPLRSDGTDFTRLLTGTDTVADDAYHATRQSALLACLDHTVPDVVITELFPFGRRSLRVEFGALIDAAHARRIPVLSSVRDILAPPSKPSKAAWTRDLIRSRYAGVLVHSVESIVPLSLSWPNCDVLSPRLHYTGFVAEPAPLPHPQGTGRGEIIVSAGGGNVGAALFDTAIKAARRDPSRGWRVLIGGTDAARQAQDRLKTAPANCVIEPARPDFREMLTCAAASVSMCGYNTALDILQTSTPAVFVPFDAGGEVEQSLRAKALAKQPGITVLQSKALNSESLLSHVATSMTSPKRPPLTAGLDGAAQSVTLTRQLIEAFHAA